MLHHTLAGPALLVAAGQNLSLLETGFRNPIG
jgi:hypothetical protein